MGLQNPQNQYFSQKLKKVTQIGFEDPNPKISKSQIENFKRLKSSTGIEEVIYLRTRVEIFFIYG